MQKFGLNIPEIKKDPEKWDLWSLKLTNVDKLLNLIHILFNP